MITDTSMKSSLNRLNGDNVHQLGNQSIHHHRMRDTAKGIHRLTQWKEEQHERSETEECTGSSKEVNVDEALSPVRKGREEFARAQSTKHLAAEPIGEPTGISLGPLVPLVIAIPPDYVDDVSVMPDPVFFDEGSNVQQRQKNSLASRVKSMLGMKKSEPEQLSSNLRGNRPDFAKSSSLRLPQSTVHWGNLQSANDMLQSRSLRKGTFDVEQLDQPPSNGKSLRGREENPSSPHGYRSQFVKCQSERLFDQNLSSPRGTRVRLRTIQPEDSPKPMKDMLRAASLRTINLHSEHPPIDGKLRRGNIVEIGKKTRKRSTAPKLEQGPQRGMSKASNQRPRHSLTKAQSERLIVQVN